MKQIELFNLKLNHIRIFLTAAECGSFSKAAKYLYLTQPVVTKSIQVLENELNLMLFRREGRRVQLTPAGRELYVQWKNLMKHFESSIEEASAQQEGLVSRVVVGMGYLTPRQVRPILQHVITRIPDTVKVHFENHSMDRGWEKMNNAELDLLITSGHRMPLEKPSEIDWVKLCDTKLAIFIPTMNPLSQKDEISFADLKGEQFIAFSADTDDNYLALLNRLAEEAGYVPKIACYIPDEASFEINLLLNNGVVLADSMIDMDPAIARCYPLENEENGLYLVWNRKNMTPSLTCVRDALLSSFLQKNL